MKTYRFRLFKLAKLRRHVDGQEKGFVEVWDTLESPWESIAKLPQGELLTIAKDKDDPHSLRRHRAEYLKKQGINPDKIISWELV